MKKYKVRAGLILVLVAAFALSGCGSSKKETEAEQEIGIATVGVTTCFNCHADQNNPGGLNKPFGDTPGVTGWINSAHFNENSVPSFPLPDTSCETCHSLIGDGQSIQEFFARTGNPALGTTNRPMVTCESCHGPGGNHWGIGPMPFPNPDASRCGLCHNENFPHASFAPEGDGIFEAWSNGPHAGSIEEPNIVSGTEDTVRNVCSRCHTDEGARRYVSLINGTEDRSVLVSTLEVQPNIEGANVVQCRTCHDGHIPSNLRLVNAVALPGTWSEDFQACVVCHQLLKADGSLHNATYHDPLVNTRGDLAELITDTHFDDPNTPQRAANGAMIIGTGGIEGYIVNTSSEHSDEPGNNNSGTCMDCHNMHNADNTLNRQWARSGHAGEILEIKEAAEEAFTDPIEQRNAVFNAAVSDLPDVNNPWVHYDFKGADRLACQRCHTATGFRNLANNPTGYSAADNVFTATGQQAEMLYCWACHYNNVGGLRNPGQFSFANLVDTYIIPPGRGFPEPSEDFGSFICLNCHSGRETGFFVKGLTFPDDIVGNNFGAFNSHYLAAGGIIYRTIGYEFDGLNYDNPPNYAHIDIGTAAAPGTGTNGPCIGCHMEQNEESHEFVVVREDDSGNITEIKTEEVCNTCHGVTTSAMTASTLNTLDTQYEATLEALINELLVKKNVQFCNNYPYFFNAGTTCPGSFPSAFTAWPDQNTVGAAFNLNLMEHMPGAFAHNDFYTRALLYDSLDWVDDDSFNCSVEATLGGSGPAFDFLNGIRTCP